MEIKATVSGSNLLRDLPEVITGERVLIRPFRQGDGAALWEAIEESRDHIEPWLPWGPKHTCTDDSEEYSRRMQAQWLLRENLALSIWLRSDGRFLGGTGLHNIRWDIPAFEIGYWLRKSAEGFGYMTEAVSLLTETCLSELGAKRIEIRVATGNLRSAAIPRRLGYELEGTLRNSSKLSNGEVVDMLVFAKIPLVEG